MSGPPSPFWISKTLKFGEFEGHVIRYLGNEWWGRRQGLGSVSGLPVTG